MEVRGLSVSGPLLPQFPPGDSCQIMGPLILKIPAIVLTLRPQRFNLFSSVPVFPFVAECPRLEFFWALISTFNYQHLMLHANELLPSWTSEWCLCLCCAPLIVSLSWCLSFTQSKNSGMRDCKSCNLIGSRWRFILQSPASFCLLILLLWQQYTTKCGTLRLTAIF